MSRQSVRRDFYGAKLADIVDAGERLNAMMKSPYRKHRRQAAEMGKMVVKMQDIIKEAKEDVESEMGS